MHCSSKHNKHTINRVRTEKVDYILEDNIKLSFLLTESDLVARLGITWHALKQRIRDNIAFAEQM